MDRLDAMRTFAAVADLGSFAEAARRLRLSPASVTRAVSLLEDQLGVLLLHRTTRKVKLTERGALYREACIQILAEFEAAGRKVRGQDAAPRGMLSVAAPLMFGRLHVLPIVTRLLREHAGLVVRLMLADRLLHFVEEGIDVAVRIGALADSALIAVKVGEVRRVLVASPDYLRARGEPAVPASLAGHDLIDFEGIGGTSEWHFGPTGRTGVRVDPLLAVNSADAAIAAAEAGLGITRALSYQVRDAVAAGRLRLVLDEFSPPCMNVSVVYPGRRQGSANVAAFVTAARRDLSGLELG